MKTTISAKGQITLPAEWRTRDQIRSGQQFSVELIAAGEYLLKRLSAPENPGLVDWLLSCPEKGWFQPLPSESTDSILAD